MKLYLKLIVYIFTILCFASCVETEIEDFKCNESPQLIVNGIWTTDNSDNILQVRMTGAKATKSIPDAAAKVRINGGEYHDLQKISDDKFRCPSDLVFKGGDIVDIIATGDKKTASAHIQIQQPVITCSIDTLRASFYDDHLSQTEKCTRCYVKIQRPANAKGTQYYRLVVDDQGESVWTWTSIANDNGEYINYVYLKPYQSHSYDARFDVALNDGNAKNVDENNLDFDIDWLQQTPNYYGVFTSRWFDDNGYYTLCIDVLECRDAYYGFGYMHNVNFNIYAISKAEYQYLRALATFSEYEPGIIFNNEPGVPSNIKGGTGFFAIDAVSNISFFEKKGILDTDKPIEIYR